MSKRRQAGEIIYKDTGAGFIMKGSFGVIQEEDTEDLMPCVLDCGDKECDEWMNVWLLPGETREEAEQALQQERYRGAAYHVSECQMLDEKDGGGY